MHTVFAFAICLVAVSAPVWGQTLQAETEANAVEFKWYNVNEDKFNEKLELMKQVLANATNAYCLVNATTMTRCGINSTNPWVFTATQGVFGTGNIRTADGYPQDTGPYLTYKIAINIPGTIHGVRFTLPRELTLELIQNNRQKMNDVTGYHIVYIEDVHYSPAIDHRMNAIMIPIAFLLVLIVLFTCVGLYCWDKRRVEEDRKQARIEKAQVTSGFGAQTNGKTYSNQLMTDTPPPLQRGRGRSSYSQSTSRGSFAGPTPRGGTRLPPLEDEPEESSHRRHRKSKNRKDRSRHEDGSEEGELENRRVSRGSDNGGYENGHYNEPQRQSHYDH